ncbi:MAG: fructosamine kinase family protein, partial [Planctomycetota bacterium]
REIELSFMSLFGCVGRAFYDRYHELRPIAEGFFEHRREMYQIYPLLVHAVLFGGGYGQRAVAAMERALSRAPR